MAWLFLMAWRDSRKNLGRLTLFISSIVLGISALVGISSFGDNLSQDVESQAKELLGADLLIGTNQPPQANLVSLKDSLAKLGLAKAEEASFGSMIYFAQSKSTRLVQVRALQGDFPFYGGLETEPTGAARQFQKNRFALVDQTLLWQFKARVGDSIKIGLVSFQIIGELKKAPGQTGLSATIAPRVYIPKQYLPQTGLEQKGSRIFYNYYFQFRSDFNVNELVKKLEKRFRRDNMRYDTVQRRKENLGDIFADLTRFLNLVAFIALLLGCVGVASAVQVYIKDKISSVAILRCLGASSQQAFLIYLIQITAMGLLGSLLGVGLGIILQVFLPQVFKSFLPLNLVVSTLPSVRSMLEGLAIGLGITILFALLPLLSIRQISPLRTLRASFEETKITWDFWRILVYALIISFVWGFSYLQIKILKDSFYFTAYMLLALASLWLLAKILMWLVRKFFPISWNFLWRQSLANLYRPNNQTVILIITVGLGTALMATLYLIQGMLISQIALSDSNNQPNMVLFDIQAEQKEAVRKVVKDFQLPIIQEVPIVTTRIESIKGINRAVLLNDTSDTRLPKDVVSREYRVTYRDTLTNNEELKQGKLGRAIQSANDRIYISMEEFNAQRMKVKIGDEIVFNVQGTLVKTYLGSIRKIKLNSFQTSFTVVFPSGVLEDAPRFHVLITRLNSKEKSAQFQQVIVQNFPNISIVDISLVLETAQDVLNQVAFAIQFMAFFSILTGLLVLIGSVIISKYQRMQESVLLRTLGASQKQILWINALEYFFLGSLAALAGLGLALVGSWALAKYIFELNFNPTYLPLLILYLGITLLTILIGMFNIRGVLNRPPLEILRSET